MTTRMTSSLGFTPLSPFARPFDPAAAIEGAVEFLRNYLESSGQSRYVIGLSGGIDSALVAFHAERAVGADRLLLVSMPYGLRSASQYAPSSEASLHDATLVHEALPGST